MEKINTNVFLTVAELRNFRKAADALGYTQAGISYIISSMEEELGLPLFVREYGGVELTAEGRSLLPWIRQLATSERLIRERVNDLKDMKAGEIRVAVFYSISIHWLPGIIERFHQDYPNIKIDMISCDDADSGERLIYSREADCGFLVLPTRRSLDTIPLMEEPMMASVSLQHPLAERDCFPVSELDKHPYIQIKGDTEAESVFHRHGVQPQISFTSENDYSALAMASRNLGYCINPKILLENLPFPLRSMEFDVPVRRTIALAARDLDSCSRAARTFIEYARRWVEDYVKK